MLDVDRRFPPQTNGYGPFVGFGYRGGFTALPSQLRRLPWLTRRPPPRSAFFQLQFRAALASMAAGGSSGRRRRSAT